MLACERRNGDLAALDATFRRHPARRWGDCLSRQTGREEDGDRHAFSSHLFPSPSMSTLFQHLLDSKKRELEQARMRFEELQRDIAALERAATMELPPELTQAVHLSSAPKLTKKEKHLLREKQILELFAQHEGTLHLSTIMAALKVSKNASKEWMNAPIDQSPENCPWERVEGNKSRFTLKKLRAKQGTDESYD
jgi:hypothetical protein